LGNFLLTLSHIDAQFLYFTKGNGKDVHVLNQVQSHEDVSTA